MNAAQLANLYARETWWETATRTLQDFPGYANLAAYWPLNGNYLDWVGANHLTPVANPVFAAGLNSWSALDLESGSSQYARIDDNSALSMSDIDFAIAVWVNLESKPATEMDIISKYETVGNQREYRLRYYNTDDRFRFVVSNDGSATTDAVANNLGSPSTGTPYFIFSYHDSVNNVVGIQVNNGTANTTAHTTGVFNGTSPLHIGSLGRASPTFYFDGLIQQVLLWKNYIPTTTERTWLYNSGAGRSIIDPTASFEANLLAKEIWSHA